MYDAFKLSHLHCELVKKTHLSLFEEIHDYVLDMLYIKGLLNIHVDVSIKIASRATGNYYSYQWTVFTFHSSLP